MSTFSAPSSSVVVNRASPTRLVVGSRLSSRWTHAAAASAVIVLSRARRSAGEAILSSLDARTAAAPMFHVVHTERLPETSASVWATWPPVVGLELGEPLLLGTVDLLGAGGE